MKKHIIHFIQKKETEIFFLWLFLIALFFFKTPSFYIFPLIKSSFLMSQALGRIFLLASFGFIILKTYISENRIVPKGSTTTISLLLLSLFAVQSLSIIPAINLSAFIGRYKDIVIAFISFFIFYYFRKHTVTIISSMIVATGINMLYQSLLFFFPDTFISIMRNIIYEKHFNLVESNIYRGRIYADIYDEILIPFLFLPLIPFLKKSPILRFLLIAGITFFAFASNFRTRILMLVFSIIASVITLKKMTTTFITASIAGILILMFITNVFLLSRLGYSFYDRFFIPDEYMDRATTESRFTQIKTGFQMGTYSIFGVGLGNYYDHLSAKERPFSDNPADPQEYRNYAASLHIHNNIAYTIAESGYLAGFIFIVLLGIFAFTDIRILLKSTNEKKGIVIAFWCLFIYGFLNPTVPASYQILFWGFRGLLL